MAICQKNELYSALAPYATNLRDKRAFARIAELGLKTGRTKSTDWENAVVLDLAGGHIGNVDGGDHESPFFFPWFATAMTLLGASAYSLDKLPYESLGNIKSFDLHTMTDAMKQLHTLIVYDLKEGLENPTTLANDLCKYDEKLASGVDLINCTMFLSLDHIHETSPSFAQQIGLKIDLGNRIVDTQLNRDRITTYLDGIKQFATLSLKKNGILYLNDEIYRKGENKLIAVE